MAKNKQIEEENKDFDPIQEEEIVIGDEGEAIKAMNKAYFKAIKKKKALDSLVVEQYNVPLDANETAQNNMTSVLAIANWQFNKNMSTTLKVVANAPNTDDVTKAMLLGLSNIFDGLYKQVYKQKIFWKGADNKTRTLEAETIAGALYKAMKIKAKIIKEHS